MQVENVFVDQLLKRPLKLNISEYFLFSTHSIYSGGPLQQISYQPDFWSLNQFSYLKNDSKQAVSN